MARIATDIHMSILDYWLSSTGEDTTHSVFTSLKNTPAPRRAGGVKTSAHENAGSEAPRRSRDVAWLARIPSQPSWTHHPNFMFLVVTVAEVVGRRYLPQPLPHGPLCYSSSLPSPVPCYRVDRVSQEPWFTFTCEATTHIISR